MKILLCSYILLTILLLFNIIIYQNQKSSMEEIQQKELIDSISKKTTERLYQVQDSIINAFRQETDLKYKTLIDKIDRQAKVDSIYFYNIQNKKCCEK